MKKIKQLWKKGHWIRKREAEAVESQKMIEAISELKSYMSEVLKSIGETLSEGFGQWGAAVEQVCENMKVKFTQLEEKLEV